MTYIITLTTTLFIISQIVMTLAMLVSKKSHTDREKNSPFECGFDPKKSSRIPFSLQFFLIALIFLIFDIEIAFLIPMIISLSLSNIKMWSLTSGFFLLILTIGLFHEWNEGSLNWTN
uniref:NADH-ubiquinone oxidoreductase chain 3 n=1 Tax=Lepidocampa weberi TaxID=165470 RepID=U3KTM7_9HEXA|nr:NADH dehydrogenase subunit 3 [Lepidocampa weberi]AEV44879.1 NADH dehydrogenase subunit 3 [Lepidocampa weberi]